MDVLGTRNRSKPLFLLTTSLKNTGVLLVDLTAFRFFAKHIILTEITNEVVLKQRILFYLLIMNVVTTEQ